MADTQEQGTIDWDKAPEWANYVAKDKDGSVFWYSNVPQRDGREWRPWRDGTALSADDGYSIPGPWEDSLRKRPENNSYTVTTGAMEAAAAAAAYHDTINNPGHYQGKVECIDAIEAATEGLDGIEAVCTGNAIKYLFRWKKKGGRQDLEKARWYINKLLGDV